MKKTIYILGACFFMFLMSCGTSKTDNKEKEAEASENNSEALESTNSRTFNKGMYEYHLVEGAGLDYKGKIVHGETWADKNGENIMIFCEQNKTVDEVDGPEVSSTYLYAYHYAGSGKNMKLIREVKDSYEKCIFVNHAAFQKEYIEVTDLDKDNYGEITFTYRTGCNSDPTPVTQKLIMLENGEKYAIRGTTRIDKKKFGIGPSGSYGGETNVDPSFNKAPKEFLDFAKDIWNKAYVY